MIDTDKEAVEVTKNVIRLVAQMLRDTANLEEMKSVSGQQALQEVSASLMNSADKWNAQ